MSPSLKYATSGVSAVALILVGLWPLLGRAAWMGVVTAAAIAVPVQIAAFAILNRYHGEGNGFLAAWVGGTLARMVVLAVTAIVVIGSGMEGAVPLLLALAGFFFGLLLLEPIFFRSSRATQVEV
ncbi:MAG: hypothetical protein O2956_09070 [Gemmatimonadetes bacterium]|nr:hypothetical protein [Gemmatimonadota bacterium]